MSWELNDEEFQAVVSLPGARRYEYFIKRVAAQSELWGLHSEDGWVVAEDDDGTPHLPLWPHPRFAEVCASGEWADAHPASIDVDEWVVGWSANLERDGLSVAVFQTPDDQGVGVAPSRLKHDLDDELTQFEL
jgi:hypothetical protein